MQPESEIQLDQALSATNSVPENSCLITLTIKEPLELCLEVWEDKLTLSADEPFSLNRHGTELVINHRPRFVLTYENLSCSLVSKSAGEKRYNFMPDGPVQWREMFEGGRFYDILGKLLPNQEDYRRETVEQLDISLHSWLYLLKNSHKSWTTEPELFCVRNLFLEAKRLFWLSVEEEEPEDSDLILLRRFMRGYEEQTKKARKDPILHQNYNQSHLEHHQTWTLEKLSQNISRFNLPTYCTLKIYNRSLSHKTIWIDTKEEKRLGPYERLKIVKSEYEYQYRPSYRTENL